MISRLFRPRTERMIAGVCGGLGLYFGIDPVIVRLLFVVLAMTTGLTVILYPVLWLIMPEVNDAQPLPPGARFDPQTGQPLQLDSGVTGQTARLPGSQAPQPPAGGGRSHILAYVLVVVGALILLDNLGHLFGIALSGILLPLMLVGLGVYLLLGSRVR